MRAGLVKRKQPCAQGRYTMAEQEQTMSFWDHIEVLRWALFRIACCLCIMLVFTFWAMPYIFDEFILAPTTNDFFVYRYITELSGGAISFSPDFHVDIININVASQFMTHIETSIYLAAILTFPYIVYEIWKFIEPALFDEEIKHLRPAFIFGTAMFYIGCTLGYLLIFPFTFRFLMEYELSASIHNQINLSSYIGNFSMLVIVMGLVFEMPLLAWLLSALGILRKGILRNYRRHAVVALMVMAAFITPSGDPFTLMLVFVPLFLLYELSILLVKADELEEA